MPIAKCPSCEIAMEVQNYEDVMIDACPSCRGVWLDRGELQKIIAHVRRQEAEMPSGSFDAAPARQPRQAAGGAGQEKPRKSKKRGFWDLIEDIID